MVTPLSEKMESSHNKHQLTALTSQENLDGVLALAAEAVEELLTRHKADATIVDLEMQLDLREKFFSLVSHDLRSPLTVVKASAEMIRRHPERVDICASLSDRIVESVSRIERMITDLLDANRFRAGAKIKVNIQACDLHELICHLSEDLAVVYGGQCRYEGTVSLKGYWDPEALRRALENLVNNAVKYGAVRAPVSIRLNATSEEVEISVHNSGNPISEKELATLFQWHSRTISARQSKNIGWGLGLMLVKGITEAHGGTISVTSNEATGTIFSLKLPRDSRIIAI